MAGAICPHCGEQTFFTKGGKAECSRCGTTMTVPPNDGKGGRGKKCPNCKRFTVFGNTCRFCGATFNFPKNK